MTTPPMFYIRQKYDNQTSAITAPFDLSVKRGGVVATKAHYAPNYLSIPGDKGVSSEGTILSCEELFEALVTYSIQGCELIYLSNYDFQEM